MNNLLLRSLDQSDRDVLKTRLTEVDLPRGFVVDMPGRPITDVYFVTAGLVSIVAKTDDDQIEIGVIGREGMTALPTMFGSTETVHEGIVQIAGSAVSMPADEFRALIDAHPTLFRSLLRYAHVQLVQVAQTALANGRRTVEQRLARWLLMVQDRTGHDTIAMTHDFFAIMLGVRRPGVTVALHVLEGEHAIRSRRGRVQILSRDKLMAVAGGTYGLPERMYEKVFGIALRVG